MFYGTKTKECRGKKKKKVGPFLLLKNPRSLSSQGPPDFLLTYLGIDSLSIRAFSNESVIHIRWATYWNFSFGMSPSNEYSGLISFRTDWFELRIS